MVWREPAEESVDIYPGLTVWDGRVTGSITAGQSRLPLWAFVPVALQYGWEEAERGWNPSDYNCTSEHISGFLYDLLEARGEFGRLLCTLANAEYLASLREDDALKQASTEGHPGIFSDDGDVIMANVSPWDEEAVSLPGPWWEQDDLKQEVIDQLKRCLAVLEE